MDQPGIDGIDGAAFGFGRARFNIIEPVDDSVTVAIVIGAVVVDDDDIAGCAGCAGCAGTGAGVGT
jgi:hypothetical protein